MTVKNLIALGLRTAVLYVFWIVLSGKLDPLHLAIGFGCAVFISAASLVHAPGAIRLRQLVGLPIYLVKAIAYLLWLLSRIFLAAIHVSKLVLDPKMPIQPKLIQHKTILNNEDAQVVFANSITLTPGTITADISDGVFTIHRLDEPSSEDIDSGSMESHISRLFAARRK